EQDAVERERLGLALDGAVDQDRVAAGHLELFPALFDDRVHAHSALGKSGGFSANGHDCQGRPVSERPADDPRTDAALVDALNRGDASAFDALYYRHRDWVVRLARRFTGSDDEALDVLQETFAYLFRKFPGFMLTAKMTTFLYPVVRNLSIAARRKRRSTEAINEEMPGFVAAGDAEAARSELAAAMANLSAVHREV